jgi:hypothetical protein
MFAMTHFTFSAFNETRARLIVMGLLTLGLTACGATVNPVETAGTLGTDRGTLDPTVAWLGSGLYTGVDLTALPASSVCSDKSIFGSTGTAVCASAPASLDATAAFVAGNYNALTNAPTAANYRSNTTIFNVAGTMAEPVSHASTNSTSNSTTVTLTPTAGYWNGTTQKVSITDAALVATNIRSGSTILGVAGDSNVVNTSTGDAVASEVLSGKKAWVDGAEVTGSMTNQGALNLNTTAIPGSSSGFYSSIVMTLSASSVCTGTSIFGSAGSAACMALLDNRYNDLGTPGTKRKTPRITGVIDDDGYYSSAVTKVDRTGWNATTCGITSGQTIQQRINECASGGKFGANATWDGATKSNVGHGKFVLVSRAASGKEVWRDERTKLLWSSDVGNHNWCRAAGVGGGGGAVVDPNSICDDPGNQNQGNPESVCAEGTNSDGLTLQAAIGGENWAAGTYDDAKGQLGAHANAGGVQWQLPTREDYFQAYADGIGFVIPDFVDGNYRWTASLFSGSSYGAWYFVANDGGYVDVDPYGRESAFLVRCVGR